MSSAGQEIWNGAKATMASGGIGVAGGVLTVGIPCVIGALAGPVALACSVIPCLAMGVVGTFGAGIYNLWNRENKLPAEDKADGFGRTMRIIVWSALGYKAGKIGFGLGALAGFAFGVGVLGTTLPTGDARPMNRLPTFEALNAPSVAPQIQQLAAQTAAMPYGVFSVRSITVGAGANFASTTGGARGLNCTV